MTRIMIVGISVTGNAGATSMLHSIMDGMRRMLGDGEHLEYRVFTMYPEKDRAGSVPDTVRIVAYKPAAMAISLILSIIFRPLAGFPAGRRLLSLWPPFREMLGADIVVDACGIAFMDGRGISLLIYNLATFLPPILLGKSVCKLSQALGPFRGRLNRLLAKAALPRCSLVVARGKASGRNLDEIGVPHMVLPDTAITMPVGDDHRKEAVRLLDQAGVPRPDIAFSPSRVVMEYCRNMGIDYVGELRKTLSHLRNSGKRIVVLPHSTSFGDKNDDMTVCNAIAAKADGPPIPVVGNEDPRVLRAIFAISRIAVVSRFHAMISCLAVGTPVLVFGWSHKYKEMAELYGVEELVMDYAAAMSDVMLDRIEFLWERRDRFRETLAFSRERVFESANRNYILAAECLRKERKTAET